MKNFLYLLLLTLTPFVLNAQVATVGTGTATSSGNGSPIYRSSSTSTFHYSKSVQLYRAADLIGIPVGSTINTIAFQKSTAFNVSGTNAFTLDINIKNSSATALASGTSWTAMTTGATLVYSNTINSANNLPAAAGFWTLTLSTPIVYTGGSLEIYVDWNPTGTLTSPFTGGAFSWNYTTGFPAQSLGTSNSVAIPNTTTSYTLNAFRFNAQFGYTAPLPCTGMPTAGTITPATASKCNSASQIFTASGFSAASATTYQWLESSSLAGPYVAVTGGTGGTTTTYTTPTLTGTTTMYYRMAITCTPSALSDTTAAVTFNVGTSPTMSLAATPPSPSYCVGSTNSTVLDASSSTGAVTYVWSPAVGLNSTTGSIVTATPATTTTYVVTGADAFGCSATASQTISFNAAPIVTASATLNAVCAGSTTTLNSFSTGGYTPSTFNQYTFTVGTDTVYTMTGASLPLSASSNDDAISPVGAPASLSFPFKYNNSTYTTFKASPDGFITFGTGVNAFTNSLAAISAANVPTIAALWDDLATGTNGFVNYETVGTAPNRIIVVNWFVTAPRLLTGSANANFQIWLYEGSNVIEFHYGAAAIGTTSSASIGLSGNTTGTEMLSVTPVANTTSTTTANNAITTLPVAGTKYTFTPSPPVQPIVSVAWTPTAAVVNPTSDTTATTAINSTTIFTITATDAIGCTGTQSVTVTANPLGASTASATDSTLCAGDSTQLNAAIVGGGAPYTYSWFPTTGMPAGADTLMNPMAAPGSTTTYTVTVTDACASSTTSSVIITVNPLPTVVATTSKTLVCANDSAMLNATGADTYVWTPGNLIGAVQTVIPTSNTNYIVTGTDAVSGCIGRDTISLMAIAPFYTKAIANKFSICSADTVMLNATDSIPPLPYCSSNFTNVTFEHVTNVTFETINNTTVGISGGPVNYTSQVANVVAGTASTLSVSIQPDALEYVYAWIDWNQNGILNDAGEEYVVASSVSTSGPFTLNITPPLTAVNGPTRMRVMLDYNNNLPDPCRNATYGEAEDYTVNVSGGVAPPAAPPYTYSWQPGSLTGAMQTLNPNMTTTYVVTQTDTNTCKALDSVTINVNQPAIVATPGTQSICAGDTTAVIITAAGGTTYTWTPSTGLTLNANGDTAFALPANTTIYTVSGTDTNNCAASAMATVIVSPLPIKDSLTASPAAVCQNSTSQLNAYFLADLQTFDKYSFASTTGATLDSMNGATTIVISAVDDDISVVQNIGFNFVYDGVAFTQFKASPDGYITLGSAGVNDFSNSIEFPNSGNTPSLFPYWDDLATGTDGAVKMLVTGTAPNRILKVDWIVTAPRNTTGPANSNFQAWLYEGSNNIEFRYGAASPGTSSSASVGLLGNGPTPIAHYQSITTSSNTTSTSTVNNGNTTLPAAGMMYSFMPPATITNYVWSPSAAVANPTSASTVTTPIAATTTYTITATNAAGCMSVDSVTVSVNPLGAATAVASIDTICAGDTTTLNAGITGGGTPYTYVWTPNTGMVAGADSTQTPMAAPTSTTTYTVTVTDACNSTATSSVTVTVNPAPVITASASDSTLCQGDSTVLTASGSGPLFYIWNPGNLVGAVQTFTPTVNTSYTVIVQDTNTGCTSSISIPITVFPQAYVVATASTTATICAGDSVNLNATDSVPQLPYCTSIPGNTADGKIDTVMFAGVTTGSSPTTPEDYTDYTSVVIPVIGGTTYPLIVRNGGSNSIHYASWLKVYIDYNQNNNFDASELVYDFGPTTSLNGIPATTVNIPTTALNGQTRMRLVYAEAGTATNFSACGTYPLSFGTGYGETEDYTVDISGATAPPAGPVYTYTWMPSNLNGAPQTVLPNDTTTYIVTQTGVNGCKAMDSVTINVAPTPTLALSPSPSASVCTGDTVTLMSGAAGFTTLTWNGNMTAGLDTTIAPVVGGTYTVVATNATSGCSATDSILVTVNSPLPFDSIVASATTVCATDTVSIQAYPGVINILCNPSYSSGTGFGDFIDSVGGILNNATGASASPYFTYYTTPTATIVAGTPDTLYVKLGTYTSNDVAVWIDYNQDNVFDAAEKIGEFDNQSAGAIVAFGVNAPISAFNGVTRMRIQEADQGTIGGMLPCTAYSFGETEDYNITITGGATLPAPSPGFTSIAWSPATYLNTTSGASVVAQGIAANITYTVVGTNAAGCTTIDSVSIIVNPLPTVVANASATAVCPNDSVTLTGSGTAAVYDWDNGVLNGIAFPVPATTTYVVTGTAFNGCMAKDTIVITANPVPMLTVIVDSNESCPGTANGQAHAVSPGAEVSIFEEGFITAPSASSTLPNAAAPGWTRNGGGSLQWSIDNNGGNSSSTGPNSGANTPGYLFLETSSTGTPDTLISPSINLTTVATPISLRFFTHMYGATINKLELYIDNGTTLTQVFSDSGQIQTSSNDPWTPRLVNLDAYAGQTIVLKYVGYRGTSFTGDIAVDDIKVFNQLPNSLLWSTSSTNDTIFGLSAGTYTVTATNSFGCTSTDSAVITTLQTAPAAPSITTIDPLCITGTGSITVDTPSGTGFVYGLNGIYQSSPMFDTIAGTYAITARTVIGGCTSLPTTAVLNSNSAPCEANITLGVTTIMPSILIGDSSVINFRINNIGTTPTNDTINVTIGKPTDGTLILSIPAGWSVVTNNSAIIQLTTTNVIQPGIANSVIIPAVYQHNGTPSSSLKSALILADPGSGGEVITNDNSSGIFIQVN